ncbi:MAG: glycosyltransferase, partial [Fimbriimonadaceae bacterium]|nr:glycosyltransferase [Fimbriimonadaceae bacterium]
TLDLFAQDLAASEQADVETDFLIGFCLAIRRSTLNEVSEPTYPNLAFDPIYEIGGSDDGDLCYRLRRAGYRLLISNRSFVHHHGSASFARISSPRKIMRENDNRFRKKWYWDLETGFASHLPGHASHRIVFDENKRPETLRARARARSNLARTSLCMIVKNEERVIRQCLESALHFFAEVIIVDTGSTDRTKEICAEMGVKVIDFEWVDSFAAARNESLRHATLDWIMWLDADDVLPFLTGFAVQDRVIDAPRSLKGIIVPVQFIETEGWGTRVDHVKVFRRLPGLAFDGRIHEQILNSLNQHDGVLIHIDEPVLHAGYDNSPEGQARKFERDYHLLTLELRDKPNCPYVHFCWGMTEHHAGNFEEAAEWFRKSFEKGAGTSTFARKAYALWSQSFEGLENLEEATRIAEEGLDAVGPDPELHFVLGRQLSKVKRIDEALAHLEKATEVRNDSVFNSVDLQIFGPKTFSLMCDICAQNDRLSEALTWGRKAIETSSNPTNAIHQVFSVALKASDWPTVQEMQGLIFERIGPCELWAEMRAQMAEVVGGAELGVEELTRVARHHPRSLAIRLVLVRRLLRANRYQEAEPHLRYLADRGIAEAAFEMGRLAHLHGQNAEAIRWLELADDIEPDRPSTVQFLEALRNMEL